MMPIDRDRFRERLLAAIKLRDISIEEAARRCDMPVSSLECWIYKRHLPGMQALIPLSFKSLRSQSASYPLSANSQSALGRLSDMAAAPV